MPIERDEALRIIEGYYESSRDSEKRKERIERSTANNSAFRGEFDFSAKVDGQSTEVLPKVTTAVESFAAYIKRGLTQSGNWFRADIEDDILDGNDIVAIINEMTRDMPDVGGGSKSLKQVVSDGAKVGALDSIVVFKVYGRKMDDKIPPGLKIKKPPKRWALSIDVMPFEDYFPDPTGRKLFEIHEKTVDLFQVQQLADAGVYDKEEVENIKPGGGTHTDRESDKDQLNRDESSEFTKTRRATVSVREFYGTMVSAEGELLGENLRSTAANNVALLQAPKQIEEWGGSPFAVGPLTRVPHTVWHRAPMDHVSELNQSLNELYNLIFDSGISAVHGVKEIRTDWLSDPDAVSGGIAPQQTIAVNSLAPPGMNAITVSRTGALPGEVINLLQLVEKEILEAAMTNEIRIGGLPEKKVLATEIVQADSNNAVLLESVLSEYEEVLSSMLTKAWQIIVQNMPDIAAGVLLRAVGREKAMALSRMDDIERFSRYVKDTKVVVSGLSGVRQAADDLRKLIAVLATVRADPVLFSEYQKRLSSEKLFAKIFAMSGIDLTDIGRTNEEIALIEQQTQVQAAQLRAAQAAAGGGGVSPLAAALPQDSQLPGQVPQGGPANGGGLQGNV